MSKRNVSQRSKTWTVYASIALDEKEIWSVVGLQNDDVLGNGKESENIAVDYVHDVVLDSLNVWLWNESDNVWQETEGGECGLRLDSGNVADGNGRLGYENDLDAYCSLSHMTRDDANLKKREEQYSVSDSLTVTISSTSGLQKLKEFGSYPVLYMGLST
jgi:hypothetical protein